MSFTIKPISAILNKDLDTFSKMDPYVKIMIGNKKYRSRTHKSGGKTPAWNDTFQVIPGGDLLMKVQLYDEDVIKDDFLGQGYFNLGQLMNIPGITQNQYIDLIRHKKSFGRVLISMKYNGSPQNQNIRPNQNQQPWNVQGQMPLQNYPYGYNGPSQNTSWQSSPQNFNKQPQKGWNQNQNPNQNQGWNNTPYNQENIPPYQAQKNIWGEGHKPTNNYGKGNQYQNNPYGYH